MEHQNLKCKCLDFNFMGKIIITGPTCSGKSALKRKFISVGYKPIIQFTTREIREGEIDGFDYDFLTETGYSLLRNCIIGLVANHRYENGTAYGITEARWESGDVLAVGAKELSQLGPDILNNSLVIYLDIDRNILRERLIKRGDSDSEAERRLQTDKEDYENFDLWDIRITDPKNFKI